METVREFERCIYCFAEKGKEECCPVCGYENGYCDMPGWWLMPGTIIKGAYMVGQAMEESETELTYLGWNLSENRRLVIKEYFPKALVKRDVTVADAVSCIPGKECLFEQGRQEFFDRAKLYYDCVSRVEPLKMDFFLRNETCYYVKEK